MLRPDLGLLLIFDRAHECSSSTTMRTSPSGTIIPQRPLRRLVKQLSSSYCAAAVPSGSAFACLPSADARASSKPIFSAVSERTTRHIIGARESRYQNSCEQQGVQRVYQNVSTVHRILPRLPSSIELRTPCNSRTSQPMMRCERVSTLSAPFYRRHRRLKA